MKKNIFVGIIILLILGGVVILTKSISRFPREEIETPQLKVKEEISLTIDDGESSPKVFKGEFREGMTVFDLLSEKTQESNLYLKTKTYDLGIFIEAIGDKENGEGGKYWLYYVNGELPMVAADKKELRPGDKVEFKFEESPF